MATPPGTPPWPHTDFHGVGETAHNAPVDTSVADLIKKTEALNTELKNIRCEQAKIDVAIKVTNTCTDSRSALATGVNFGVTIGATLGTAMFVPGAFRLVGKATGRSECLLRKYQ